MNEEPVTLSEQFLLAVRHEGSTDQFERALAEVDSDGLARSLDSDEARLAFWVNLYNAGTQQLLDTHRDSYEKRRTFFSLPAVTVAGTDLSLDDIEHRILRRSYSKYTLGYVRSPFRGRFARAHEVDRRDPRIHFALNCGAESCPPIAAYTRERIDEQLDVATESYLDQTVEYVPAEEITVPRVMWWFRGDFGGKSGIVSFLQSYGYLPEAAAPRLRYDDWDWSLSPGKFAEGREQDNL